MKIVTTAKLIKLNQLEKLPIANRRNFQEQTKMKWHSTEQPVKELSSSTADRASARQLNTSQLEIESRLITEPHIGDP